MPTASSKDFEIDVGKTMTIRGLDRPSAEEWVRNAYIEDGISRGPTPQDWEIDIGKAMKIRGLDRPKAEEWVRNAYIEDGIIPKGQEMVAGGDETALPEDVWRPPEKKSAIPLAIPRVVNTERGVEVQEPSDIERRLIQGAQLERGLTGALEIAAPPIAVGMTGLGALRSAAKHVPGLITGQETLGETAAHIGRGALGGTSIGTTIGRAAGIEPEHISAVEESGFARKLPEELKLPAEAVEQLLYYLPAGKVMTGLTKIARSQIIPKIELPTRKSVQEITQAGELSGAGRFPKDVMTLTPEERVVWENAAVKPLEVKAPLEMPVDVRKPAVKKTRGDIALEKMGLKSALESATVPRETAGVPEMAAIPRETMTLPARPITPEISLEGKTPVPERPTIMLPKTPISESLTPTQELDALTIKAADELASGITPKQLAKSALRAAGGKETPVPKMANIEVYPSMKKEGSSVFGAIGKIFTSPHNQKVFKPVYDTAKSYSKLAEFTDRQLTALQDSILSGFENKAEAKVFHNIMWAFDREAVKITPQELGKRLVTAGIPVNRLNPLIRKGMDERRFQDISSYMIGKVRGKIDPQREAIIDKINDSKTLPAERMELINKSGVDVDRGIEMSPYVSPRREGHLFHLFNDWYVEGSFPFPDKPGYGENIILQTFRNPKDAIRFAEKEAAGNPNIQYRIYPKSILRDNKMLENIALSGYSTKDALKIAAGLEKHFGMGLEEAREIAAPTGHRFLGMLMERKGIQGFDMDIVRSMDYQRKAVVRYIQTEAVKQHTSQLFFGKYGFDPFKDPWEVIKKSFNSGGRNAKHSAYDAKALYHYIRRINGNITPTEEVINDAITSVFKVFNMEPPSGRPSLYYQTRMTKLIAALKLGVLNPSSFIVNLGQSALVLAKTDTDAFLKGIVDIAHPSRELRLLYRQMGIEKTTKFGGLGEAGFYQIKSPDGKLTAFNDFLMLPFRSAEVATRRIAAAAALNMAKKSGGGFKEAVKIADKLITETLFDYSILDSPAYLSNPASKVLFQFKQFSTKYLEAVAGMNAKEFAKWAGATAMLSGVAGAPLSATAAAITKGLGFDIDAKMKEALYQWAAKGDENEQARKIFVVRTILRGLPASTLGVDLSRRFGVDVANLTGNETMLEALASTFTGPAASTAVRVGQEMFASSPLLSPETKAGRTIGAISPGLKNIYTAVGAIAHEAAGEPQAVRGFKEQLEERPGAKDIGKMSLGLKPLSSSERIDIRNIELMHREEIKGIKDKVDAAIMKRDPNAGRIFKEAILAVKTYDPEAKYDETKRLLQRIKEQRIPELERQMLEAPKTMLPMINVLKR